MSYPAAATRITASNDTDLPAAQTSLHGGETGIPATPGGPPKASIRTDRLCECFHATGDRAARRGAARRS